MSQSTGSPAEGSSLESITAAMHRLAAQVRECERCPLHQNRTHAVPGEGDYNTVVMFVGEGPGAEEDRQGRPFVGPSGQFLTQMLHRVGIQREGVYITNVVKCRPPKNRDPLPQEIETCTGAYLDRQIDLINPRIVVTLGRFSMARWFPGGRITRIHGQIRNIGRGRVAMAMFHPAAALRNPTWQEAFEKDFRKLPLLIERARAADEAAALGEQLPAGVPHPGDPDYADPGAAAADTEPASPDTSSATRASAADIDSDMSDIIDDNTDDSAEQLSLF